MTICDTCIDAFAEEGMGFENIALVAPDLGAEIADHDCDARGNPESECSCSCPKRFMDQPESGKTYRLTGGPGDKALSNGNSWAESEVK